MNSVLPFEGRQASSVNASIMLSLMLVGAACMFADIVVAMRGITIGTDTHIYAAFFLSIRNELIPSRYEPGFLLFTRALSATGMSVNAYQGCLFALMLATAVLASRRYFDYLQSERGFLTFLVASLMFLFLSPVFVNGTINAARQGLSSLLVFVALLAFYQRQWKRFALYGILAASFHYSAILYLASAPALLLSARMLRLLAVAAFLAYCSGLTLIVVRAAAPPLYAAVMDYVPSATYRSGVRLDFAVFSIFWYLLPYALSGLIREPYAKLIRRSTAIYLIQLLPFFLLGWGNYSNRYLLPAWMSVSLMLAAIFFHSRLPPLRNPVLLRGGLVVACAVFAYFVANQVTL